MVEEDAGVLMQHLHTRRTGDVLRHLRQLPRHCTLRWRGRVGENSRGLGDRACSGRGRERLFSRVPVAAPLAPTQCAAPPRDALSSPVQPSRKTTWQPATRSQVGATSAPAYFWLKYHCVTPICRARSPTNTLKLFMGLLPALR